MHVAQNSVVTEIMSWAENQEHGVYFLLSPQVPSVTLDKSLKLSVLPIPSFIKQRKRSLCYELCEKKGDKAVRTSGLARRKILQEKNCHADTQNVIYG